MAVVVTVNAVDRTDYIPLGDALIEKNADRQNGIFSFHIIDEARVTGGTPFTLRERQEVIVTDGGTRVFGGQIATIKVKVNGLSIDYAIKCQSFDSMLDHRIVEDLVRSGSRTDASDVGILTAYTAGIDGSTFVSTTETVDWDIDYSGLTVRAALDKLSREVGGTTYWVDDNKKLHWGDPLDSQKVVNTGWDSNTASWALAGAASRSASTGPGGTGDFALVTTGTGSGRHETTQTVTGITGNRRYLFFADMWQSVADKASVRLDWQNSGSTSQRVDVLDGTGMGTSSWFRKKAVYTAPASATKVIVMLGGVDNFTGTVRHDNMALGEETAAWGVHTTPNGTTTHAVDDLQWPSDATRPINRVLVRGDGISEWREYASSIAYFGAKYEGILNDNDVSTAADITQKALTVFRKYAFPRHTATYETYYTGLQPGTWQILTHEVLNVEVIEWISEMKIRFTGNNNALYQITLGAPEDSISSMMMLLSGSHTPGSDVDLPPPPGVDADPPALPTGLALTTGQVQQSDGTLRPWLLASWNAVADSDLDAYELQLDRAIEGEITFSLSASGTGGSLAAGTYRVLITGVGTEGGESLTQGHLEQDVTAGQRLYVNITAKTGIASFKIYATRAAIPLSNGQTTSTTGSNVEITSEGAGAAAPSSSTAVAFSQPTTLRGRPTSQYTEDVRANFYYAARVRAIDDSGNASSWTAVVGQVVAKDTSAPSIPTGLTVVSGFRLVGLRWARNTETDILIYEIRFAVESSPGSGTPDTAEWVTVSQDTSAAIIDGLTPELVYFFQVRAIDRSGNVRTSAADSTAVTASDNPEAGWSNVSPDWITATPTLVGAADVAFGTVLTDILTSNTIDASHITTGELAIGGPGLPPEIVVYNASGQEIGRWDLNGLLIKDPNNTDLQMRFVNGQLEFTEDGGAVWTTAINAQGIRADSITFGTSPGGHNPVPNSGFELASFGILVPKTWTSTTDWDDGENQVFVNVAGAVLTLSSSTY